MWQKDIKMADFAPLKDRNCLLAETVVKQLIYFLEKRHDSLSVKSDKFTDAFRNTSIA